MDDASLGTNGQRVVNGWSEAGQRLVKAPAKAPAKALVNIGSGPMDASLQHVPSIPGQPPSGQLVKSWSNHWSKAG